MKAKEVRGKETSNLQQELTESQRHLYDLRSQAVTEKLEDPTQLGKTRKEIARIKTILRQRELETSKANSSDSEPAHKSAAATAAATKAK